MGVIRKFMLALPVMAFALAACGGSTPSSSAPASGGATSVPAATVASAATRAPAATAASTATSASAATPTTSPAAVSGSARDAVIAAMRKQLTVGPYRSKTKVTSDKTTMDIVGDVIPPDRMRVASTINGRVTEQIYIGNQGWNKIGAGAWTAVNSALITTTLMQINGSAFADIEAIITDVKSAGADTVDGAKTLVYTYVSDLSKAATPMNLKSTIKVWINETTGLIVKNEISGTAAGVTSKTVQTVEYDKSITIEPPK